MVTSDDTGFFSCDVISFFPLLSLCATHFQSALHLAAVFACHNWLNLPQVLNLREVPKLL